LQAKPQGRPAAELNEREVAGEQSRGRTSEVKFKGEDHSDPFHVPHELLNEFAPQELEEIIGQFHEVFLTKMYFWTCNKLSLFPFLCVGGDGETSVRQGGNLGKILIGA
jgi:hypothetical protein